MKNVKVWVLAVLGIVSLSSQALAEDQNLGILRQGLLGAGVGAISAEASGGKAGQGALIGAGTNVIGGALLSILTGSPTQTQSQPYQQPYQYQPAPAPTYYSQPRPVQVQVQPVYVYRQEPVYIQQPQPVYYSSYNYAPQEDPNRRIIRQGLLGAGVGAVSSYASGGKAGKGALIGAGTNVIGGALLEILTAR